MTWSRSALAVLIALPGCAAGEGTINLSGTWLFAETTTVANGDCAEELGTFALSRLVLEHQDLTDDIAGRRLADDADLSGGFSDGRAFLTVEAPFAEGIEHRDYNLVYEADTDRLVGRADWLRRDATGEVVCRNFTSEVTGVR